MPKITFCFKDYLEELRIIFALQVLPVLETHVCQVAFRERQCLQYKEAKGNSP